MTPTAEGSSRMQSLAPAGTVTQHGKALTPIQALEVVPKTKPGHRRSFSYMNTVVAMNGDATSAGISPNGRHVLDARDWVRTLKVHDEALSQMSEMERQLAVASGKFDVVLAPTITSAEPLLPSAPTLTSRPEGILDEIEVDDGTFYDAVLIATDNDFLETSATRAIFRENAVNPADCTLFEMPPFTGDEQADAERRLALEMQDMPLPCDSLCCPTDQQLRAMTRTGRWFHMVKCYLMVMIVTVIVVALIFTATTSRSS